MRNIFCIRSKQRGLYLKTPSKFTKYVKKGLFETLIGLVLNINMYFELLAMLEIYSDGKFVKNKAPGRESLEWYKTYLNMLYLMLRGCNFKALHFAALVTTLLSSFSIKIKRMYVKSKFCIYLEILTIHLSLRIITVEIVPMRTSSRHCNGVVYVS